MGDLFGRSRQSPQPVAPTPAPPPTMPDPLSPSALEARRRTMAQAGQAGRASTTLSTAASRKGSDTLAGSYGATKLGANT